MIETLSNFSLKTYNTFGLEVFAHSFCIVKTKEDIQLLIVNGLLKEQSFLLLGGGSNILFTKNFEGLVIKNEIEGINIVQETDSEVWITAESGTIWHDLVLFCVQNNFQGIENLALIPGTVGAAPMQNIGAYGVEVKDVLENIFVTDLTTGEEKTLPASDCAFGYRDSKFKQEWKNKYFINNITIKLRKKDFKFNTSYGNIQDYLGDKPISVESIANAVIAIRTSKLPNPKDLGNAGSFFKNPEINSLEFKSLQTEYPEIPYYIINDNTVKIPAAWLIEQCGFKGKVIGNTGNHAKQSLVLVNYGEATGTEIWEHAQNVIQSVKDKFKIELSPEVNVL